MDESNVVICENCYEENEANRTTCKNCGCKLYNNIKNTQESFKSKSVVKIEPKEDLQQQYEYNRTNNKVATIIKVIAIIFVIICTITCLATIGELELISIVIFITGLVSSIFVYALGEIIQLLEDIKNK